MTEVGPPAHESSISALALIGLVLGPAVFVVMILMSAPSGLSEAGWSVAAVVAVMAIWWISYPNKFKVYRSGQKRGITPTIRKELRRRSAVEAVMGHLK